MKRLQFKKIDAFASGASGGNPAGYITLKQEKALSTDEMLLIASQLKGFVNEVGYVYQADEDAFKMKYYSSEREVDFCGHATIAIAYDLIKNNKVLLDKESIHIMTNKGKLKIENKIKEENAVYIFSPEPEFIAQVPELNEIKKSLDIDDSILNNKYPVSIINAGLNTLIVPVNGLVNILKISPDFAVLKNFCLGNNIDIVEVFSDEVFDKKNDYRTRVFAPVFGYLEDPATGSGNSAFGYYLIRNNLLMKNMLTIEQNNEEEKYNVVKLRFVKDDNNKTRVLFGGPAITRIEGEYII